MIKACIIYVLLHVLVLSPAAVFAQKKKAAAVAKILNYQFESALALAGDGSHDELFIDQENRKLYVSHGTSVQVVDLDSLKLAATLGPFLEAHSIAVVQGIYRSFISDSKANAVFAFDTRTFDKIEKIAIQGRNPHQVVHDLNSNELFVFNWGSRDATIINPVSMRENGTVALGGNPEIGFSNSNGLVYNTIEDRNNLVSIDTKSKKVFMNFALGPCLVPTALAYDALNERIFVGCRASKALLIVNAVNGKIITSLPIGEGVTSVAYDPENKLVIAGCAGGTASIVLQRSADTYEVVQTLDIPKNSGALALDSQSGKIFLSTSEFRESTHSVVPGTFRVMIYNRRQKQGGELTKR